MKTPFLTAAAWLFLCALPRAQGHAFPDHAEPKVGGRVAVPPAEVRVWFTQKLVAMFSDLRVFDESGKEVDKRDKRVDASDPALLVVSVPTLKPGKYKVVWRAASVDTHVTNGDFTFEVGP